MNPNEEAQPMQIDNETRQIIIDAAHKAIIELLILKMKYITYLAAEPYLRNPRVPKHISMLSGERWMQELISNPNPTGFCKNMGMNKSTFFKLKNFLKDHAVLVPGRWISTTEKLGILIYMLRTGNSNKKLQKRFQRGAETISVTINKLITNIANNKGMLQKLIILPGPDADAPPEITTNEKFHPYFKDCLGVVDGTHVPVFVPNQHPFINSKGYPSQNVLAACDFNMMFTYIMSGWEGSITDRKLWDQARMKDLTIPEGKFLLANAGFDLNDSCLVPYHNTCYMEDWNVNLADARPKNAQELFNLRHSSARNVIERTFGLVKRRFPVLGNGCHYPYQIQVKIILVMVFIHNFIRHHDPSDDASGLAEPEDSNSSAIPQSQHQPMLHASGITQGESRRAAAKRDVIAQAMWADYLADVAYADERK